jgi:hypothetical protein
VTAPTIQQQTPQDRRATAAAMAAAMIAAAKTPQAIEVRALAAIRQAAGITQNAEAVATRLITAAWATVNPYDDASVGAFAARAGQIIVAAQRSVASVTTAAQVQILRAAGVTVKASAAIPDDVRGATVHFGAGEPAVLTRPTGALLYQGPDDTTVHRTVTADEAQPSQVFTRAAKVYRYSVSQDNDPAAAHDAAVTRIGRIVDGNLMLAQRLAEQQTLVQAQQQEPRVIGYRRVIHPELSKGGVCGLCVAASDRIYNLEDLKPIHDRCKCTVAAVLEGGIDPGVRLNRADLRSLYTDAGRSTAGTDLKRTRYDIVQHHELGPILTRVQGEKVPYYSVAPLAVAA